MNSAQPVHGGNLTWAASLAGCSPFLLADFSASINPLGPPTGAIAAIQANWEQLRHYPDPEYRALRQALAEAHRLHPDWILPGNGAAELLTWAGRDLSALDQTIILTPGFGDYFRALRTFGGTWLGVPVALTQPPPHLPLPLPVLPTPSPSQHHGLLLNNPHNPTGWLFSRESLRPYLETHQLVVVDEAFMDFLGADPAESVVDWVPDFPNLVVVRSLTKFYSLPGLRLGYAIAHPDVLQRWQQWRDPWSVNSMAEVAAIASLADHAFQQRTWEWLPEARSHLWTELANLPGLQPLVSAANFLLVRAQVSVPPLQQRLLQEHQVLIRDCMSFAELGDRYFRVAVRTLEENQRLLTALRRVLSSFPADAHGC
ncbi:MAG: threonine-phosphate decarboxylase CobD [Cyanobacteria bacterium J06638_22]